jgi:hypothetical protein
MYSHRTQQMNTTSYLNKQVGKIIVSREPIDVVRRSHILYRQDRYALSKNSKFENFGLLGTTKFRKGGTYFIYQSIRGNIPEYLNRQQHAVRISHVHSLVPCSFVQCFFLNKLSLPIKHHCVTPTLPLLTLDITTSHPLHLYLH